MFLCFINSTLASVKQHKAAAAAATQRFLHYLEVASSVKRLTRWVFFCFFYTTPKEKEEVIVGKVTACLFPSSTQMSNIPAEKRDSHPRWKFYIFNDLV